jgi:DNA invertase Pin-like site-specific DNA recombinase
MSNGIKVAVYARVSTLLGQDPSHQLIPIREMALNRNFQIVSEFIDVGISGTKDKRPALDQLIKAAKHGKFKILIVYGIDRLGRSTKHLLNLVSELNYYGVSLISMRESLDFTTPMGQMALTMLGAVAQLEAQLISERIKTSLAVKKQVAISTGSNWKCGRPSISKEVEDQVLHLRKQGLSVREIAKRIPEISKSSVSRVIRESASQNPSNFSTILDPT